MYGPNSPQPMTEETPQRATGRKGRARIVMAARLLEAHRSGRVRVAIGHSSDYYGPRGKSSVAGDQVFRAALKGKKARAGPARSTQGTIWGFLDRLRRFLRLSEGLQFSAQVLSLPLGLFSEPPLLLEFLECLTLFVLERGHSGSTRSEARRGLWGSGRFGEREGFLQPSHLPAHCM
jgi:hypothetical protein